jgi:2-hydroxycyclohexanecarboxyl-CoA dehydrogenase
LRRGALKRMEGPARISGRPLQQCSVLIAGGTSGVGLASAMRFAESGVAQISIVGRDLTRGETARRSVQTLYPAADIQFLPGDVNQATTALRIADAVVAHCGRIDVLVNATVGPAGPTLLHQTAIEDIERIVMQQMLGPLLMSRAVLPAMRAAGGGVILNIASDAGKLATPGETVIGAAMAGIIMFSRTLAIEAKRDGIRVNVLTPSLIDGTLTTARMAKEPFAAKLFETARRAAQLGVAVPEDLAELIVFLSGPQAARITGQAISVNGGISAA